MSGASIAPISVSEMFLPSPFAENFMAEMSPEALSVKPAAFVFRAALSSVKILEPSHVNGRRKFSGISMTSARGIERTPEAEIAPSSSLAFAEIFASILPFALRSEGANCAKSSRLNAVRNNFASRG